MLTILGSRHKHPFCDGITRRSFLRIGGLALGGLTLPQILRAEAASGVRNPHKAVIMIFLPGGPPHQDMFDLKMDAPAEIRGEFKPIKTNVPGIEICEHLPRIAGDDGQVRHHSLDRRRDRRPRRVPVSHRPPPSAAAAGRLAGDGLGARQAAWAPATRRCRRSSVLRRQWDTCRGPTLASPASSASRTRRSSRTATARATWCSTASRSTGWATARRCWPASTASAARPTPAA